VPIVEVCMPIGWLIVLSIVIYIAIQYIRYVFTRHSEEPPWPVRVAGMAETAFGTLVWGGGLFVGGVEKSRSLGVALILLGLFWIGVAVSLYKASRIGRTICLVLSIVRIPTIIGALFSLLSIYKLYFTQESKDFFNKTFIAKNNP
jgi:hypothetical protein